MPKLRRILKVSPQAKARTQARGQAGARAQFSSIWNCYSMCILLWQNASDIELCSMLKFAKVCLQHFSSVYASQSPLMPASEKRKEKKEGRGRACARLHLCGFDWKITPPGGACPCPFLACLASCQSPRLPSCPASFPCQGLP